LSTSRIITCTTQGFPEIRLSIIYSKAKFLDL